MIQTYDLTRSGATPLYEQLYRAIRHDILSGALPGGTRLASKRALAEHLSVSKLTVETAYAQLVAEGYITARQRSGYYVEQLMPLAPADTQAAPPSTALPAVCQQPEAVPQPAASAALFPFSVWARLMRTVLLDNSAALMTHTPAPGALSH